jgi:hypothetical protein
MTYSVLGINTTQVKEVDPRTGKDKNFYLPTVNQQTGLEEKIRLAQAARRPGIYILGATGTGKSSTILNLALQDTKQGKGIGLFDPHSDLTNKFLELLPEKDLNRVVILDPLDDTHVFGLNLYACADPSNDVSVQATYEQVEHIFDVLWHEDSEDQFGPQVREGLLYSSYALIYNSGTERTGCGMLEIPLLFQEGTPRAHMVQHIQEPVIRSYWENKYEKGFDRNEKVRRADMVINKLNEFIANPIFRRIVGQSTTTIDFKDIMDNGKILLVKLPGRFERMAQILGAMIIAQLLGASYARESQRKRPQFNIYADDYQRFATRDFAKLLTEASRKYNTPVTIAHQARDFIDLKNKAASLQVPNLIVLRCIRKDADEVAGNFDDTPIRTKKVLKRRTKPVFKEWDEYFWDSKNAEQQYIELGQSVEEAKQKVLEAEQQVDGAHDAVHIVDTLLNVFRLARMRSENDYLRPYWLPSDDVVKKYNYEYIPYDSQVFNYEIFLPVDGIARNLTLCKFESETIHDYFYYWPDWWNGKAFYNKYRKRVDYSYLKRVEWYTLKGDAAVSRVEHNIRLYSPVVLDHGRIAGKKELHAEFRKLLEELIEEVHEHCVLYYEGVRCGTLGCKCRLPTGQEVRLKFIPELTPETPAQRVEKSGEHDPSDAELWYPTLAHCQPPEVGGRWGINWDDPGRVLECGKWEVEALPTDTELEPFLTQTEICLEAQVKERKQELEQNKQVLAQRKQRVKELTQQWEAYKTEHYQPIHHKEYLGEQPATDPQTRISHSNSDGSSESTGYSRMGTSHSFGRSASHSTSYSTADVQWFDLVDELDQTHAQRRDEIASEIANFPDYIARVKIKDENDEFVEYTIRTLAPERGLAEKALNERIARIKETMIAQNIIRPKHVIDEEVKNRQQLLRLPPQEPPQEDEPPVTRRK